MFAVTCAVQGATGGRPGTRRRGRGPSRGPARSGPSGRTGGARLRKSQGPGRPAAPAGAGPGPVTRGVEGRRIGHARSPASSVLGGLVVGPSQDRAGSRCEIPTSRGGETSSAQIDTEGSAVRVSRARRPQRPPPPGTGLLALADPPRQAGRCRAAVSAAQSASPAARWPHWVPVWGPKSETRATTGESTGSEIPGAFRPCSAPSTSSHLDELLSAPLGRAPVPALGAGARCCTSGSRS